MNCLLLRAVFVLVFSVAPMACAQSVPGQDPFGALSFLLGTWDARTMNNPRVTANGSYTFLKELNGHVLARHSTAAGCKGPEDFNCQHGDLLYVYTDAPGQPLRAIYFDNEGHVIHYAVATPTAATAEFLSDASAPGPQFRLVYELRGGVMMGKFQLRIPGQQDWKSYLEWTGSRADASQHENPASRIPR